MLHCIGVESVEAWGSLRPATAGKLLIPTTDTVTIGRCGFYYASPAAYNSLPPHMTDMSMSFSFWKLLKTLLQWHTVFNNSVAASSRCISDIFRLLCTVNFCLITIIIITLHDTHVWNVDVKYFRSVQVNTMKTTLWTINDLQSLAFFNCQINSNRPVNEIPKCLKQFQQHTLQITSYQILATILLS